MKFKTGVSGKSFNDRVLAGEVRTLALTEIKKCLNEKSKKNKSFREALILRLAGSLLPRLNEVSGPDGEPIPILGGITQNEIQKDNGSQEDTPTKEEA